MPFVFPRIHLLISVFVTDKSLLQPSDYRVNSPDQNKFNQLLSMLHSFSRVKTSSQDINISLDESYRTTENLEILESFLREYFPNCNYIDSRLETFSHWSKASSAVPKDCDFILLNTNHDHVYLHGDSLILEEYCSTALRQGIDLIAISHWPESIGRAKATQGLHLETFLSTTSTWTIGTVLTSRELFLSWWDSDFTSGSKIVRPDNPFGPSVKFKSRKVLVPNLELVRHLDGYGHTRIWQPSNWVLRPCCSVQDNSVIHSPWRADSLNDLKIGRADLCSAITDPGMSKYDVYLDYIKLASSSRINLNAIKKYSRDHELSMVEKFKLFCSFLCSTQIWHRLIAALVFEFPATCWSQILYFGLTIKNFALGAFSK